MFGRNQNNGAAKEKVSFGKGLKKLLKKNYLASFFVIATVGGGLLDYILGTMPSITCAAMVISIFIGSCLQFAGKKNKKYNPEKEEELKGRTLL